MSDVRAKYDAVAEEYSRVDYADAERYYARRAAVVARDLSRGDTLLDIACGDGGLGRHLLSLGIDYRGVDGSERMIEVARRSLGDRVVLGGFDYEPPQPVEATTIFRSLYLVPERHAFLERVRSYTRKRLVFDFDPRAYDPQEVLRDVARAGWSDIRVRPFLTPQKATLPFALQRALWSIEPLPGVRVLTRARFPLLVSASPA